MLPHLDDVIVIHSISGDNYSFSIITYLNSSLLMMISFLRKTRVTSQIFCSVPIEDDQPDPGESPFFEILEQSRPELLILTICGSHPQVSIPTSSHSNDHKDRLGDVPCSVTDFVAGGIHEEVRECLFDWP